MAVGAADPLEGPSISFEQPDYLADLHRHRKTVSTKMLNAAAPRL
jgi:hypothetical protein